jgi:hypothetical protein
MQPNDARPKTQGTRESIAHARARREGCVTGLYSSGQRNETRFSASTSPHVWVWPAHCHTSSTAASGHETGVHIRLLRRAAPLDPGALQIRTRPSTHAKTLASSRVHEAPTTHELFTVRPTNATHVCKLHEAQGIRTTRTLL